MSANTVSSKGTLSKSHFQELWDRAFAAGMTAGQAATPRPMVVGTPKDPLGNDIDPNKPVYLVPEGVCGFAWVNVKPGTSSFARWLKERGIADPDSYYGGVTYWVGMFGQSYTRKAAFAKECARVLRGAGINAIGGSRLD